LSLLVFPSCGLQYGARDGRRSLALNSSFEDPAEFGLWLRRAALECGALEVCCLDLEEPELRQALAGHAAGVERWLDAGLGAEMDYLRRHLPAKAAPWEHFPGARSALVISFLNGWGRAAGGRNPFPAPQPGEPIGLVSAYARGPDYHHTGDIILKGLAARLQAARGEGQFWPCVDSRPVFERFLALRGGLGVLGPNDLVRTREHDVRAFLGVLFTSLPLPERILEAKPRFPCLHCQDCLPACPTGALKPGQPFDSRLCISYLTIEKKGALDPAEQSLIGDWIFGCDHCSEACPPTEPEGGAIRVGLRWLLTCSSGELKRAIAGTALERCGPTRLRRNAVAVLANQNSPEALALLDEVANCPGGSELIKEQIRISRLALNSPPQAPSFS
jgi:epoxyqueuosine reductase